MDREKLFEFAKKKGWHEVLKIACDTHTLSDIAKMTGKKESLLGIELRAMAALGLVRLIQKRDGTYAYLATVLGIKFLQEENKKIGRTFSCQLCGTTTGMPHICPCFYPEFRQGAD